jgi:tetratricopeptide (TPR) repeat protein
VKGAQAAVTELREIVDEREKHMKKNGYAVSNEKATDLREAEAWLAFAQGKSDEALTEMRAAADRQDKEGGESVNIPAREMLADLLMEMKRPKEAQEEYALELKTAPNRFDGLLGAARAAQANGDASGAQTYFAKLVENCGAGADRPELAEAKTVLARK